MFGEWFHCFEYMHIKFNSTAVDFRIRFRNYRAAYFEKTFLYEHGNLVTFMGENILRIC